jgi:uncharacterized membrane protein YvbJ
VTHLNVDIIKCPKCGAYVDEDSMLCKKCGYDLEQEKNEQSSNTETGVKQKK